MWNEEKQALRRLIQPEQLTSILDEIHQYIQQRDQLLEKLLKKTAELKNQEVTYLDGHELKKIQCLLQSVCHKIDQKCAYLAGILVSFKQVQPIAQQIGQLSEAVTVQEQQIKQLVTDIMHKEAREV